MHYFLYPTKDTTLSNHPNYMFKNMGLDEILEVEKRTYTVTSPSSNSGLGATDASLSRALLHFNLTQISQAVAGGQIPPDARFFLSLKIAESQQVPVSYTLAAWPLAKEWTMGTGYKCDGNNVADGASWKFSDGYSEKWWPSQSLSNLDGGGIWFVSGSELGSGSGYAEPPFVTPNPYDPFPYCDSSGSIPSGSIPSGSIPSGSIPTTGSCVCQQTFDYQTSDVYMDVTCIVQSWLSGEIPNYGLIVLHSGESDNIDYGKLRFFSKETNTVYSPHLDICWDASTYNTGSGTSSYDPVSGSGSVDTIRLVDAVVNIKNMSAQYRAGSLIQFLVSPRKRYPIKTFTNKLSDYLEPAALPYDSFYVIKDAQSEEVIIPYDFATRLSFDPDQGNYFYLDTTGLPQERYFKLAIRSEQSGSIRTFDIPTTFKITR